jgi:hypothetical protein
MLHIPAHKNVTAPAAQVLPAKQAAKEVVYGNKPTSHNELEAARALVYRNYTPQR